jgi:Protein of unknown function (DUF4231)
VSPTGERQTERWPPRKRTGWNSRSSVHLTSGTDGTPLDECDQVLDVIRQGVGSQRRLAQCADLAIIGTSASIPVFFLLSTQYLDFYLGKLVPAVLAALTATLALLLKVLKPHERWRLLRSNQAHLEAERFRYLHRSGNYAGEDHDIQLLNDVVETSERIAGSWFELMPDSAQVAQLTREG